MSKTLSVQAREGFGKGPNRRLRTKNIVPAVYYTEGQESVAIQVPAIAMEKFFHEFGRTTFFNLEIDNNGKKTIHPVLIWDIQFHPFKKQMKHVDFYGVDLNKDIKITVPLEFTGTSKGVKIGGTLEIYREKIVLIGKPQFMPKKLIFDITDIELNQTLRAQEIKLPEGVTTFGAENYAILAVVSATAEEEEIK